jgi:hypothetical protein
MPVVLRGSLPNRFFELLPGCRLTDRNAMPTELLFRCDQRCPDVALLGLFTNGGDVALLRGMGGGTLNKTAEFYQGTMDSAVVVNLDADTAPDIA